MYLDIKCSALNAKCIPRIFDFQTSSAEIIYSSFTPQNRGKQDAEANSDRNFKPSKSNQKDNSRQLLKPLIKSSDPKTCLDQNNTTISDLFWQDEIFYSHPNFNHQVLE